MPIDASIALQTKLPQIESPLNGLANVLKIQGAQQDNQIGQAKLDEYNRATAETRATNDAYRAATGADGTIDRNRLYSTLAANGAGSKLPGIQKEFTAQDTALAAQKKAEIEAHLKKFEVAGQIMGGVSDQTTWDRARAQAAQVFGPDAAAQMPAVYDPALVRQKQQQALSVKDQLEQQWKALDQKLKENQFGETVRHNTSTEALTASGQQVTMRGQNMTDARAAQTLKKDYAVAGMNQDGTVSSDIDTTARAIASGQLPAPTGMALLNPKNQRILSRVMEINPQYDYTTVTAKKKAASDFTTGALGNSMRSFQVAGQHLDQLGQLVDALDNGNMQVVNKISNTISQQTGSPAVTNFDAAKDVVSKEVVKAIVAGGGGVAEREELSKLMDNAKSPKQLKGVIQQYRTLMGAQHDALLQQRRAAGLSDSTLPNYAEAAGSAAPAAASVPPDIAAILKKHGGK